jgi:hypothetical protein
MKLSTLLLMSVTTAVLLGADRMAVGLTRTKTIIEAATVSGTSLDVPTVLRVGGLQGDENAIRVVTRELNDYSARKQSSRPFRLLAIHKQIPTKFVSPFLRPIAPTMTIRNPIISGAGLGFRRLTWS